MAIVDPSVLDDRALRVRTRLDRAGALLGVLDRADVVALFQPGDRMLLELSLSIGRSSGFVAKYLGWKQQRVRRRLAHYQRAVGLPAVRLVLDPESPMTDACRKVALLHLLVGEPVAEIARRLRMCPRSVRRHLAYLRGWSSATSYLARRFVQARSNRIGEDEQ